MKRDKLQDSIPCHHERSEGSGSFSNARCFASLSMTSSFLDVCFKGLGGSMNSAKTFVVALMPFALAGGCTVGPDYHRPDVPVPAHYSTTQPSAERAGRSEPLVGDVSGSDARLAGRPRCDRISISRLLQRRLLEAHPKTITNHRPLSRRQWQRFLRARSLQQKWFLHSRRRHRSFE